MEGGINKKGTAIYRRMELELGRKMKKREEKIMGGRFWKQPIILGKRQKSHFDGMG